MCLRADISIYQYMVMGDANDVMEYDMKSKSELSNAALRKKQDTTRIER